MSFDWNHNFIFILVVVFGLSWIPIATRGAGIICDLFGIRRNPWHRLHIMLTFSKDLLLPQTFLRFQPSPFSIKKKHISYICNRKIADDLRSGWIVWRFSRCHIIKEKSDFFYYRTVCSLIFRLEKKIWDQLYSYNLTETKIHKKESVILYYLIESFFYVINFRAINIDIKSLRIHRIYSLIAEYCWYKLEYTRSMPCIV